MLARSPHPSAGLAFYTEAAGSGMGRYSYDLAHALAAQGVDLQLIAPRQPWEGREPPTVERTVLPTPDRRYLARGAILQLARAAAGSIEAWRAGRAGRPIVINHFAGVAPFSMLCLLGAKAGGARRALILHDFYPHTLRFPRPLQGLERYLFRWAYRQFDLVAPLTETQIPRLVAAGVPAERIFLLPSGVFPVLGVEPPAPGAETTFLAFGNPRINKRLIETIRAVQRLRAQGLRVRLRIAGAVQRPDAGYWRECLDAVAEAPEGVEVIARFIEEEEFPAILSGVDAFICPYKGFISQSGVAMLALSSGVPLVATEAACVAPEHWRACVKVDACATAEAIEQGVRDFLAVGSETIRREAKAVQDAILVSRSWSAVARELLDALKARGIYAPAAASGAHLETGA